METQPPEAAFLEEKVNGNVRFRLHEFQTAGGPKYGVEVSAYSSFADQWKLQEFTAGMDLPAATELFDQLADAIGGYCWMDDEYLPKSEQ